MSPSPSMEGSGEGAVYSPENVSILDLKTASFCALSVLFVKFQRPIFAAKFYLHYCPPAKKRSPRLLLLKMLHFLQYAVR